MVAVSVIAAAGLLIGLGGFRRTYSSTRCQGIEVVVLDSASNKYLSSKEIIRVLDKEFGGYLNRFADKIELDKIEKVLDGCLYLDSHEAYLTRDGILHIEVTQRTPVAKIVSGGANYYLDESGKSFRVSEDWCKDLLCIGGSAPMSNTQWSSRAASLVDWVNSRSKWRENVVSFRSEPSGEMSLRLKDREEIFVLGQPTDFKAKFARIEEYLEKVVPSLEEGVKYNKVILKYNNQIVCK